ncbi:AarF/ABC1/UbiB kinase family protein [Victivallis sp. Marseille-Q1083]|uniref:ABC1 kinase family protein n=1 Tax=Victivallis sp. Marseille-Q1083 TaxID=2717288 RepID=UPI00158EA385|nr:AarF/UbiB family protein [Victivallis sp. Marseille-Q1083]
MSLFRKFAGIDRRYASFKRYLEILDALVRFGFGDLQAQLKFGRRNNPREQAQIQRSETRPVRVRLLLEALGPTFIKLGQILSTRPDLVPEEYIRELSKLQENVPGFAYERVRLIIEKEFDCEIEQLFAEFEPEPFAAASIGQVHRAKLPDGKLVVVKVQRPGITRKIDIDLTIMRSLAEHLERISPEIALMRPQEIIEEFSHVLRLELDYLVESAHAKRFAQEMSKQPGVYVPVIYDHLSTHRVLTMERLLGVPATDLMKDQARRREFDLKLLAHNGAMAIFEQIFTYGFFHADPHPGNIFILPGNVIGFIDFGMMGRVSEHERYCFIRAIGFILNQDYESLARAVLTLTVGNSQPDMIKLERDVADLVEANIYLSMEKLSLARVLEELMHVMNAHHLALRPNLYIMIKAVITIESLAKSFDPDLQIIELLKPFMRRQKLRQFDPRRYLMKFLDSWDDMAQAAIELPGTVGEVLKQTSEGKLKVRMEHSGLNPLIDAMNSFSNRLSFAIVLASLIVGSSLIVLSRLPPRWHGVPIIGLAGFLLSGVLGFILVFKSMHRDRSSK